MERNGLRRGRHLHSFVAARERHEACFASRWEGELDADGGRGEVSLARKDGRKGHAGKNKPPRVALLLLLLLLPPRLSRLLRDISEFGTEEAGRAEGGSGARLRKILRPERGSGRLQVRDSQTTGSSAERGAEVEFQIIYTPPSPGAMPEWENGRGRLRAGVGRRSFLFYFSHRLFP